MILLQFLGSKHRHTIHRMLMWLTLRFISTPHYLSKRPWDLSGKKGYLEIVKAISGPNGDLARRVALVELEIHIEHNKLPGNTS
jgi:hypothetical protein